MYYSKKRHQQMIDQGFDVVILKNAYRVNGCVDIYFSGATIFNKTTGEYIKHETREEAIDAALKLAGETGKVEPFRKTAKGNMTYQEFKHRMMDRNRH
jgi:hypothetical protein